MQLVVIKLGYSRGIRYSNRCPACPRYGPVMPMQTANDRSSFSGWQSAMPIAAVGMGF